MVSRPTGCHRFGAFKPPLARIRCIGENINDPYRIGIRNIVIKSFRKPGALGAAFAFDETLHVDTPCNQICIYHIMRSRNVTALIHSGPSGEGYQNYHGVVLIRTVELSWSLFPLRPECALIHAMLLIRLVAVKMEKSALVIRQQRRQQRANNSAYQAAVRLRMVSRARPACWRRV